jgi:cytochrome P450
MKGPQPPFFDERLDAWVLSRYRDVAAAFHENRLIPTLPLSPRIEAPPCSAVHLAFRTQARLDLPSSKVKDLEPRIDELCQRMIMALPLFQPGDIIRQFAEPWSLEMARMVCAVGPCETERLARLARQVFEAFCEPYDQTLADVAREAVLKLAEYFRGAPVLNMQMFIALANSLPCFLGNAWLTLLQNPDVLSRLRRNPALLPKAVDELLRLSGPARAQFREAASAIEIAGCAIERGQRLVLVIESANVDPEQFEHPTELHIDRTPGVHLALGIGPHTCLGATLIRTAAFVATRSLLSLRGFSHNYEVSTVSKFAVRYVESLVISLLPVTEQVRPDHR